MGKGGLFGGLFGGGGGLGALFSELFGGLGLGGGGSYSTYGGERALCGPVSPSNAYLVGESDPEILRGISGNIASNADSRRIMGGNVENHYHIDARGTDPQLVRQHVMAGMAAADQAAPSSSLRATAER